MRIAGWTDRQIEGSGHVRARISSWTCRLAGVALQAALVACPEAPVLAATSPLGNAKTADFVAYCEASPERLSTNSGTCPDKIFRVSIAMMLAGETCIPDDVNSDQVSQVATVVKWIKAHPTFAAKPADDAIAAAYHALYPCK